MEELSLDGGADWLDGGGSDGDEAGEGVEGAEPSLARVSSLSASAISLRTAEETEAGAGAMPGSAEQDLLSEPRERRSSYMSEESTCTPGRRFRARRLSKDLTEAVQDLADQAQLEAAAAATAEAAATAVAATVEAAAAVEAMQAAAAEAAAAAAAEVVAAAAAAEVVAAAAAAAVEPSVTESSVTGIGPVEVDEWGVIPDGPSTAAANEANLSGSEADTPRSTDSQLAARRGAPSLAGLDLESPSNVESEDGDLSPLPQLSPLQKREKLHVSTRS